MGANLCAQFGFRFHCLPEQVTGGNVGQIQFPGHIGRLCSLAGSGSA
jgi:hypothetical protein